MLDSSNVRLAVPRTLLYYRYFPLWQTFFNELGVEVETSAPSCAAILKSGSRYAHTDSCLPIKLAFGHVKSLFDGGSDYMFLPRFFRLENNHRSRNREIQLNPEVDRSPATTSLWKQNTQWVRAIPLNRPHLVVLENLRPGGIEHKPQGTRAGMDADHWAHIGGDQLGAMEFFADGLFQLGGFIGDIAV